MNIGWPNRNVCLLGLVAPKATQLSWWMPRMRGASGRTRRKHAGNNFNPFSLESRRWCKKKIFMLLRLGWRMRSLLFRTNRRRQQALWVNERQYNVAHFCIIQSGKCQRMWNESGNLLFSDLITSILNWITAQAPLRGEELPLHQSKCTLEY